MPEAAQPTQPSNATNHVVHAILTLITGGLWLPVWLYYAIRK